MNDLSLLTNDVAVQESVQDYLNNSLSFNTKLNYSKDIKHYEKWGGILPGTVQHIILYLNHHAKFLRPTTLARRLKGIKNWHVRHRQYDPTSAPEVKLFMKSVRRKHTVPPIKATPLTIDHIKGISFLLKKRDRVVDSRNLALILIGFFGVFRRSELVGIKVEHLTFSDEGVKILIPISKTDQDGQGTTIGIPYGNSEVCPVNSLKEWLRRSAIESGYIFKAVTQRGNIIDRKPHGYMVSLVIKGLAAEIGIENPDSFKGHSLRRGFATAGITQNIPSAALMEQGRWKNFQTFLGYYGDSQVFKDNPCSTIITSFLGTK